MEHPPVVRLELRQPLGSYAPVAYDDLVRAGLLRIVDGKPGSDPGPSYDLTTKGRELAARFFGHKQIRRGAYVIEIPVGQFRYVPGSTVLSYDELDEPAATFKYYFSSNANAAMLLRFGPAMDWVIADYGRPHLNLDQVGLVAKQTLRCRLP